MEPGGTLRVREPSDTAVGSRHLGALCEKPVVGTESSRPLPQGAGLAFEDGYILAERLAGTSRADLPNALQAFYRERILRTGAIQGLGQGTSSMVGNSENALTEPPLRTYAEPGGTLRGS